MSQNPDAHLDQSVASAVGLAGSKLLTPLSHSLIISSLDFWNAVSRSGDHAKGALVDNKCLKGSMSGADAKAKFIWPTAPNHDRTSVMLRGVGKSLID